MVFIVIPPTEKLQCINWSKGGVKMAKIIVAIIFFSNFCLDDLLVTEVTLKNDKESSLR